MIVLISVLIPVLVGLFVKWLTDTGRVSIRDYYGGRAQISWLEFGVASMLLVVLSFGLVSAFGPEAQRAQKIGGYKEFWNGSIVKTWSQEIPCKRDGSCQHEYKCDKWIETIHHPAQYDSKGKMISSGWTEHREHWHQCPYATKEFAYGYEDSIGRNVTMFAGLFEENPKEWRAGSGVPEGSRGVPLRWAKMKSDLESGNADPVTKVNEYENYILPSEDAVLKRYSDSIDAYKEAGLLPHHTHKPESPLFDYETRAGKVSLIGVPAEAMWDPQWGEFVMRFNAQLGSELRGDLHMVIVESSKITNPDDYVNAIVADWQSNLGKWGFPKNGIVIVLGVDRDTVSWARAKTGMPEGNGSMLTAIQTELDGVDFDPDVILGRTLASVKDGEVTYSNTGGIVHDIMFTKFPFARACMECDDADDKGTGYTYLKDSIPVSSAATFWTIFAVFVVALILWVVALIIPRQNRWYH